MSSQRRKSRRRNTAAGAPRPGAKTGWRGRLDAYGGFTMLAVVGAIVVFVGFVLWTNRPISPSSDPLLGEAMDFGSVEHISDPAQLIIPEGAPPAGGPHFDVPLRAGIFDDPVPDGNAIHSLEHGLVWISYAPDLVTAEEIEVLTEIARDHGNDVILSPRPLNSMPVAAVSWGRILRLEVFDSDALEEFINVNTNRSPEPGVR